MVAWQFPCQKRKPSKIKEIPDRGRPGWGIPRRRSRAHAPNLRPPPVRMGARAEIPATPLEPPDRSTSGLSAFIGGQMCFFPRSNANAQTPYWDKNEPDGSFPERTKCTKPRRPRPSAAGNTARRMREPLKSTCDEAILPHSALRPESVRARLSSTPLSWGSPPNCGETASRPRKRCAPSLQCGERTRLCYRFSGSTCRNDLNPKMVFTTFRSNLARARWTNLWSTSHICFPL